MDMKALLANRTKKKTLGAILSVLGIVLALCTLLYGNLRNNVTVNEAHSPAGTGAPFFYTAPGLLDLPETETEVEIYAPKTKIFWAVARSSDVRAFLGKSAAAEIRGIGGDGLKIVLHKGDPRATARDADALKDGTLKFAHSDLWEKSGCRSGRIKLRLKPSDGSSRSLAVATAAGTAPKITLRQIRTARDFPTVKLTLCALAAALIGAYLLYRDTEERNRADFYRAREENRKMQRENISAAQTSVIPIFRAEGDPSGGKRELSEGKQDSPAENQDDSGGEQNDSAENQEPPEDAEKEGEEREGEDGKDFADAQAADSDFACAASPVQDTSSPQQERDGAAAPAENDGQGRKEDGASDDSEWKSLWNFEQPKQGGHFVRSEERNEEGAENE